MCVYIHMPQISYWDYSRYVILVLLWWTGYSVNKYNLLFLMHRKAVDFSTFLLYLSQHLILRILSFINFHFLLHLSEFPEQSYKLMVIVGMFVLFSFILIDYNLKLILKSILKIEILLPVILLFYNKTIFLKMIFSLC